MTSSSNEMNDFNSVTVAERGVGPLDAPENPSVQLNGHTFRLEVQQTDQVSDASAVGHLSILSVDDYSQVQLLGRVNPVCAGESLQASSSTDQVLQLTTTSA